MLDAMSDEIASAELQQQRGHTLCSVRASACQIKSGP
jgi:hypothetical protein